MNTPNLHRSLKAGLIFRREEAFIFSSTNYNDFNFSLLMWSSYNISNATFVSLPGTPDLSSCEYSAYGGFSLWWSHWHHNFKTSVSLSNFLFLSGSLMILIWVKGINIHPVSLAWFRLKSRSGTSPRVLWHSARHRIPSALISTPLPRWLFYGTNLFTSLPILKFEVTFHCQI